MAEDCVCTNLIAIHSVLSDICVALENLNSLITTQNTRLVQLAIQLSSISENLKYNNKGIAEIWSYKELCVSNETIVESPLSTYVSKAKLEIDE